MTGQIHSRCKRLAFFKSVASRLGQFLAVYGGWGLLGISFLDSSLVPLPGLNDFLLLHLSSQRPERAVFYALASTLGSVLGSYLMFGLARGGSSFLWRRKRSAGMARAHQWLERNDFVSILVASLLPPPAPFKAFLLAAGALRMNAAHFGLALLIGRGMRFGAEAYLGARYGVQAEAYLRANLVWTSLAVVALVVLVWLIYRRFSGRSPAGPAGELPGSSSSGGL
jgi:membrane protein YqaA with SNARE-associated domain